MKIKSVVYEKAATRWQDGPKDGLPEIALIGRSNVGKSSLINFLLGRKVAYVAKTPGKTQLIQFFLINGNFHLVDLPGYGYARSGKKVKDTWGPMIENYLTQRTSLKAVGMLIDIRRSDSALDEGMLDWLEHHQLPAFFIATKGDKISRGKRKAHLDAISKAYGVDHLIPCSTLKKEGRSDIWSAIGQMVLPEE